MNGLIIKIVLKINALEQTLNILNQKNQTKTPVHLNIIK